VRDLTAEEFADWLIQSHGANEGSRSTIEIALRSQFKWHRLQGRLDQRSTAAVIAEIFHIRQSSMALETPDR
jgi:hypothetical protein